MLRWVVLALIAAALAGCVTPLTLEPTFATHVAGGDETVAPFCRLTITKLTDSRLDPTVVGNIGGRQVRVAGDSKIWMKDLLRGLSRWGIRVSFADDPHREASTALPSLPVEVQLLTVWLDSLATSKSVNAVFRFEYQVGGQRIPATYRGSHTTVNWNSTDAEIESLLDAALQQVLEQTQRDVHQYCAAGSN